MQRGYAPIRTGLEGGADAVPADLDAVGAAMKLYGRASAASALAERDPGQPGARAAVRKADQQLRRVRDLLAPLYPAEEGQAGALEVTVEFRANTGAEAGGNKIIDWTLTIGGATVRLADRARCAGSPVWRSCCRCGWPATAAFWNPTALAPG